MSSCLIPAPCIIPLRIPFGKSKNLDTKTLIDICCDKENENIEIFYTTDGTKPHPYMDIVQGSKTIKFSSPFYLPPGKITIKAVAVLSNFRNVSSNVVTKYFLVEDSNIPAKKRYKRQGTKSRGTVRSDCEQNRGVLNFSLKADKECQVSSSENSSCSKKIELESASKSLKEVMQLSLKEQYLDEPLKSGTVNEKIIISEIEDSDETCNISVDDIPVDSPDHLTKGNINEENIKSTADAHFVENNLRLFCDLPLQHCFSCNKVNSIVSKYCDKCGAKLVQICMNCKEFNPTFAVFCQYCGEKLQTVTVDTYEDLNEEDSRMFEDIGISVKPQVSDNCTQKSSAFADKSIQTVPLKRGTVVDIKKLPVSTPGRGYWRQQLDYICNHLKAQAYNNLDFRKLIGEPSLGHFLQADVVKNETEVTVIVKFKSLSIK